VVDYVWTTPAFLQRQKTFCFEDKTPTHRSMMVTFVENDVNPYPETTYGVGWGPFLI
jgi:hypothetical protein